MANDSQLLQQLYAFRIVDRTDNISVVEILLNAGVVMQLEPVNVKRQLLEQVGTSSQISYSDYFLGTSSVHSYVSVCVNRAVTMSANTIVDWTTKMSRCACTLASHQGLAHNTTWPQSCHWDPRSPFGRQLKSESWWVELVESCAT